MATRKLNPPRERRPKAANGKLVKASTAPATLATAVFPTLDEIRARAYQLYVERGGGHGQDLDDWYAAEKQLTGSHAMRT